MLPFFVPKFFLFLFVLPAEPHLLVLFSLLGRPERQFTEGFMFATVLLFFIAKSLRSVGRSPRNFVTQLEAYSIYKCRSKNFQKFQPLYCPPIGLTAPGGLALGSAPYFQFLSSFSSYIINISSQHHPTRLSQRLYTAIVCRYIHDVS